MLKHLKARRSDKDCLYPEKIPNWKFSSYMSVHFMKLQYQLTTVIAREIASSLHSGFSDKLIKMAPGDANKWLNF